MDIPSAVGKVAFPLEDEGVAVACDHLLGGEADVVTYDVTRFFILIL